MEVSRRFLSRENAMTKSLTIELPFAMPTLNRLLAMHHWEHKKYRDMIQHAVYELVREATGKLPSRKAWKQLTIEQQSQLLASVFESIMSGSDSQNMTISMPKLALTRFDISAYCQMIRPRLSKKCQSTRKKKARTAQNELF